MFTGPEGKSPQLDKLEIECIELQVDKTALNEKIKEADSLMKLIIQLIHGKSYKKH